MVIQCLDCLLENGQKWLCQFSVSAVSASVLWERPYCVSGVGTIRWPIRVLEGGKVSWHTIQVVETVERQAALLPVCSIWCCHVSITKPWNTEACQQLQLYFAYTVDATHSLLNFRPSHLFLLIVVVGFNWVVRKASTFLVGYVWMHTDNHHMMHWLDGPKFSRLYVCQEFYHIIGL